MKRIAGLAITLVLLLSFTALSAPAAHAQGPSAAVYQALQQYYEYSIDRDALNAVLEAEGASNISSLVSDLHDEGRPIPVRLLADEQTSSSLADRYAQEGQSGEGGICSKDTRPGLTPHQMGAGLTYLCNTATREWTLFQRPAIPPTITWQPRLDEDGNRVTDANHCFYDHPTYPGTLSLIKRSDGSCPR